MQATDDLGRAVYRHTLTMDTERLSWEKAPAVTAMLRSGDAEMLGSARKILDRSVATQSSAGHLNYNDVQHYPHGHARTIRSTTLTCSIGFPLLLAHESRPDDRYLTAANRQAEAALATPRTADGGLTARLEAIELWIDWVYMLCPFFGKLGEMTGDDNMVDEAYRQLEVHAEHLVDPRAGLARHAWTETPDHYGQSTFWSRGNGWLGAGTVELLAIAAEHPGADRARAMLRRLADGLLELQDASGFWRHVLDDPDERFETSGTLMHAYWLARGAELGILDGSCIEAARRAIDVAVGCVTDDGAVIGVAVPPGGPGVAYGSTAFGQGFFIQAAQTLRRLDSSAT